MGSEKEQQIDLPAMPISILIDFLAFHSVITGARSFVFVAAVVDSNGNALFWFFLLLVVVADDVVVCCLFVVFLGHPDAPLPQVVDEEYVDRNKSEEGHCEEGNVVGQDVVHRKHSRNS